MTNETPNEKHLWDQYKIFIDNYRFNVEAAIKLNIFHYAITGAILSFYFTHPDIGLAKWSLFLPFTFSIGLTYLFLSSLKNIEITRAELASIAQFFKLHSIPEVRVLSKLLIVFSVLHIITALAIIVAFCLAPKPSTSTTMPPKEKVQTSFFNAGNIVYKTIYQANSICPLT